MKGSIFRTVLASIAISASIQVQAQTLDEESVAALERFYGQFNGEDWTVRTG